MELMQWMIDYCEDQPWDEDIRQDVYVKLLELNKDPGSINTNFLSRVYTNTLIDIARREHRRGEIRDEFRDQILTELGLEDETSPNPADIVEAEDSFNDILRELTPILRGTLMEVILEGTSVEEFAEKEGVSPNVVYQRVWEAKRRFTEGESNE